MARFAIDATAVAPGAKGIGRVARGAVEALAERGVDIVALVQRGAKLEAPTEAVRSRPAVLWEQVGLTLAARRHDLVLTFTERLPLVPAGRLVVWLFELPTRRIAENRRPGAGVYQRGSDLITQSLWRRSLRQAVGVFAGSQATAADLGVALPELRDVSVVYPGVGREFSPPTEFPSRDPYFLHLGSDDPRDNTATVLAAFERARAQLGSIGLVVVGKAATDRRVGVDFAGHVADEELVRLYGGARAFVDASLYEGFGYGPLEAMACGAPVVASSTRSVREIVGEAGLLCDPTSAHQLGDALIRIVEDRELAETLRSRGIERAREFTWDRSAADLLAGLENLL
jgi:glycosyltransferase involved in cell wall biosynthesis